MFRTNQAVPLIAFFWRKLPMVVDLCRGRTSPLTGNPVIVVGAGGIVDGRGLAMALTMGCGGAWVGTRFVPAPKQEHFLGQANVNDFLLSILVQKMVDGCLKVHPFCLCVSCRKIQGQRRNRAQQYLGTRFIAAKESSAPRRHKDAVVNANSTDTTRTLIYSGRPLRTLKTDYVIDWELNRASEITELCEKGDLNILPS